MKTSAKIVLICEGCDREVPFAPDKCSVCGKDYCSFCKGDIAGCIQNPEICVTCAGIDQVYDACRFFAQKFEKLIAARVVAMKKALESSKR